VEIFDPEKETMEDLGRGGLRLIQSKEGFRFGEDTVLLSWFVAERARFRTKDPVRALELGTNCGAASILLAGRRSDIRIDGVERQREAAALFARNIELNGLSDRVRGENVDLRDLPTEKFPKNYYDVVFANPPFRKADSGPVTETDVHGHALLEARFAMHGEVEDFISCAAKMLVPKGDLFLVDRADTASDVLKACFQADLAPKVLTFVHPFSDRPATLFLLQAKKNGKTAKLEVTAPLILRGADKKYTEIVEQIYSEE
jgi:tRNA1(Val) A37 N6-methylase TrmN6